MLLVESLLKTTGFALKLGHTFLAGQKLAGEVYTLLESPLCGSRHV
jgi:hypothetical protein